jgi:hypothetical protein
MRWGKRGGGAMTKHYLLAGLGVLFAATASPAQAKDDQPCAATMICASDPGTIVTALQKAGYKAQLTKDATGDPEIDSAASGYSFSIYFYDCVEHKQCAAIQFYASFKADPAYTEAFANKWNTDKRFLRARIDAKKELVFDHDISTIGGLNQANFADLLGWMESSLSLVNGYLNPKTT